MRWLLFRESISRRLWIAIALITCSSCLLTFDAGAKVAFSAGSVLVLLAAVCWGLENNCTRKLADKNPIRIVAVKGLCSGAGALAIGLLAGERFGGWGVALLAMLVGCFAYGMSIACYIRAQRTLGAAKTSAYYAAAPFIGSALSFLLLGERPNGLFLIALLIMLAGAYFATFDRPAAGRKSGWIDLKNERRLCKRRFFILPLLILRNQYRPAGRAFRAGDLQGSGARAV